MNYKQKGYLIIALGIYVCLFVLSFLTVARSQPADKGVATFGYKYLYSFEVKKGEDEQVYGKPRTVALSSLGQIYVVIPYAKEIRVYNPQGRYMFAFGQALQEAEEEKGHLSEPSGISIDHEDLVYISDLGRDMVLIFDSKGVFKEEFPIFQPVGKSDACAPFISYNPVQKLLYVPDPCVQRVNIYKTSGQFVTSFGDIGTELGKFGGPANCAFTDEGGIFIVDPGNFRVQYLSPAHEPKASFGSMGTKEGAFVRPYGIALDSMGRIFISDMVLKSVQVFDRGFKYIGVIKNEPDQTELLKQPLGITCSQQNRLYAVDGEAQKIHVFQIN